jgi:hypothetical protein
LTNERTWWYKRFRAAAYVNAIAWAAWTILILLPFAPFSYLQPIMVGGGAGTWFLLGYLLFPAVAVGGSTAISSLVFVIEIHERRRLNYGIMLTGLILLYAGVLTGCFLLAVAGASGGYALVIQHSTANNAQILLSSYVDPITAASLVAVTGTGFTIYGMATAKATKP